MPFTCERAARYDEEPIIWISCDFTTSTVTGDSSRFSANREPTTTISSPGVPSAMVSSLVVAGAATGAGAGASAGAGAASAAGAGAGGVAGSSAAEARQQ